MAQICSTIGRQRLSMDRGWRFHLGDIPFPLVNGHAESYNNAKAGSGSGAAASDFDDTGWCVLDLPHDWAVESSVFPGGNISQGYRRRGVAWYRRHFPLQIADQNFHLELQFDGVATNCIVWVNGIVVHRNWCGYTSFAIDITPFARFGEELNCVAVRVDANAMEGWWYEGAGLYRHTWLVKREFVHVVTDGVYVNPVRDREGRWSVPAEVTITNCGTGSERVAVEFNISDSSGNHVAKGCAESYVAALCNETVRCLLDVPHPVLWSIENPTLYTIEVALKLHGRQVDVIVTSCGFRTLRFDADHGFFLNDEPLKLKGVCCHQDHAGVGVAIPDAIWEFRVRKLKLMGVNAYRCSHNPPSSELLDYFDRAGILVMNENRHFNTSPEYVGQLEWLIRRDRNHPCVILWSICSEEPLQGTRAGYECARRLVAYVKRLDATRPVTAAMNAGLFATKNISQVLDVVGFNYQSRDYDRFHEENPDMALTSSEDTSGYMTRGEFITDSSANVIGSYDTDCAPWGSTHRTGWKEIASREYLAGGFVWTGFDYRGEPTPHAWPSTSSFFGCMDLCGFPKTAYYIHQAHWIERSPVLQLVPHWNWPGREGQLIRVMACSNAEVVSLSINGVHFGEQRVDRFEMASWDVPYQPGRIEAVATRNGKEVARAITETTGAPITLRFVPDRREMLGDGDDAMPVTVEAVDERGRPSPNTCIPMKFAIEGPGIILGHGNGDPNTHEPEKGLSRSLFNGLAQVIVQTRANTSGKIVLRATAVGLEPAELEIDVKEAAMKPCVPFAQSSLFLQRWRMSPETSIPPNPNRDVANNDMNTWAGTAPGDLQSFEGFRNMIYRVKFSPFQTVQKRGGLVVFTSITGAAEVWLDNRLAGKKAGTAGNSLTIDLPPKAGERTLSVIIESDVGTFAGLSGSVMVKGHDGNSKEEDGAHECLEPANFDIS